MRLYLIRHGATQGNLERRYVGTRDEALSEAGKQQLAERRWPEVEWLAASPMLRCMETAALIYPGRAPVIVPDLRERCFGAYENKTSEELSADLRYQAWIDSGGTLPFPEGEGDEAFNSRVIHAFEGLMRDAADASTMAIVGHGGTFMTLLEHFAMPKRKFFDFLMKNGELRAFDWQDGYLQSIEIS